jgi:TatD DNase family protein
MKIAVGVSPRNAQSYDDEIEQALRDAISAAKKNAGAIGSCGIDDASDTQQVDAFARQAKLAKELELPLIVEAPGCEDRAFEIVQEHGLPFDRVLLRVGNLDKALLAPWIEAGCFLSFNAAHANDPMALYQFVEALPADRVMVESGAPQAKLEVLAGEQPRTDQVVYVADAIISLVSAAQLAENFQAFYF